jgi:hypothetical protein
MATCVECPAPFWRFGIEDNSDACDSPPKRAVGVPGASIKPTDPVRNIAESQVKGAVLC